MQINTKYLQIVPLLDILIRMKITCISCKGTGKRKIGGMESDCRVCKGKKAVEDGKTEAKTPIVEPTPLEPVKEAKPKRQKKQETVAVLHII